MGVYETATMFFLKKPSLVYSGNIMNQIAETQTIFRGHTNKRAKSVKSHLLKK